MTNKSKQAGACLLLAATLFTASPALAQTAENPFAGAHVGATAGFLDDDPLGTEVFTYGAELGYDFAIGAGAVAGLIAEFQDSKDFSRDLSIVGRVGASLGSKVLVYALGGYTNLRAAGENLDGWRAGVGAELALGKAYLKLEQRYSNYGRVIEDEPRFDAWQSVLGAGIRF